MEQHDLVIEILKQYGPLAALSLAAITGILARIQPLWVALGKLADAYVERFRAHTDTVHAKNAKLRAEAELNTEVVHARRSGRSPEKLSTRKPSARTTGSNPSPDDPEKPG